ncbi:MAG: response regulator transcription factor [Trueperaceae bacterium]|nr:response regulator transcription factor [Trueperaceae bacterium]
MPTSCAWSSRSSRRRATGSRWRWTARWAWTRRFGIRRTWSSWTGCCRSWTARRSSTRLRREQDVPVIMLTARSEEDDRIRGLETGADDYVTKPFSPRELVARVRAVLRRRAGGEADRPATIEHRGLRIDPEARTVQRHGTPADVTTVEFDLLYALASAPGRVFRRSELLDRVWGDDFGGVDRVVDVHVSHLRRKLEPLGADGMIATVRSVGYKFE